MKIGVVIHGPEVIDSGHAKHILEILSGMGKVTAKLGGTMGKIAVMDAHMEDLIDIKESLKPSNAIDSLLGNCDAVFLLNHGKTPENGIEFGSIVMSRLSDRNLNPIIQIESPGCEGSSVIYWNDEGYSLATKVGDLLAMPVSEGQDHGDVDISTLGSKTMRKIRGVHAGELIMVEGFVIGKAISEDVSIVVENGFVTGLEGGIIKEHGLEKLHMYESLEPLDIRKAWVKTGAIRRSLPEVGIGSKKCHTLIHESSSSLMATLIDHLAERSIELAEGCKCAITVGDDTTAIAGDILYRLHIPVIGITDGDPDGFSHTAHFYPGSLVLQLEPGWDDIIGKLIRKKLFDGNDRARFDSFENMRENVLEIIGEKLVLLTNY
ncbi:hypothetical protein LI82_06930 [Methanococcoides methylutens]|uniref:DUF2117 domain-containing protein n=1 Tax=Methanococcoides methylutens TaxID=2226 RepID=A0A099T133_METMT|nr:DUF2117 domain-containing protein [Methanococcoides methylutens]KGK98599.1 hypothetical protein LI82_06930 [Methanococcoides methylutens]